MAALNKAHCPWNGTEKHGVAGGYTIQYNIKDAISLSGLAFELDFIVHYIYVSSGRPQKAVAAF